jgi:hypothetical protein
MVGVTIKLMRFAFSYSGRIDCNMCISTIKVREVFIMSDRIEKAFISILMELPFYFTLSLKERHFLLSRLTEYYQSLIIEYQKDKDLYNGF